MYCPNCGKKSEEDDNFCISCGEDLRAHKNLQGSIKSIQSYENQIDNTHYSYSGRSIENNEIQLASLESRIGAYLIDMLVIFALIVLAVSIMASIQPMYVSDESSGLILNLVYLLIFFGYFILLEGPLGKGKTVGKRALKLRVVRKDDHDKIGYGASFGRNILRIIDALPFLYIIGMIVIHDSDLNQRVGDRAAETIVITENNDNKFKSPTSLGYS